MDELERMSDDHFAHHVNEQKNDFANWVEEVLCDGDCAQALHKVNERNKAHKVVKKYLKNYTA